MQIRSFVLTTLALIAAAPLGACGGDDAPAADADAGAGADAADDGFRQLIGSSWSITPGGDRYWCATATVPEDMYIGGFRPIAPTGTHHTVVAILPASASDDPGSACSAQIGSPKWIYASGVGTGELDLPDGVGIFLAAGTKVHINLHLFNTTDATLSGMSGVEVRTLPAGSVQHEAEIHLPGAFTFSLPPGQVTEHSATCVMGADQTLVGIFPHMHQLGKHFKAELFRGGELIHTLWDDAYMFEYQPFAALDRIAVQQGDELKTTCTWDNTTGSTVTWGDSSTAEMCFSIIMRYPPLPPERDLGGLPTCTTESGF